jgi:crotonobetainyl-CoA:carnitine CoA-transferase CaiB-like acyl-CoA transferase
MRVVDLSQQLPGPYCTLLLAGLGARVTKVEPLGGDAARHLDPAMFERVNAGKTSVRLDLKSAAGQRALHDLVREADVFVEGFRPGVALRLGCDFETLAGLSSRLVYCSISGFGQTGPDASRPTHDLSLQALAGALPDGAVVESIGVPWVDLGVATTAALLIAAHWRAGSAVRLDLAMLDIVTAWTGVKPDAISRKEPTYGTFTSSDGVTFALAILEDDMWLRLCRALGLEAWSDERGLAAYSARIAAAAAVREGVQERLGRLSSDELAELSVTHDLPLDEVQDLARAASHQQIAWRAQGNQHGLLPFGPGPERNGQQVTPEILTDPGDRPLPA